MASERNLVALVPRPLNGDFTSLEPPPLHILLGLSTVRSPFLQVDRFLTKNFTD